MNQNVSPTIAGLVLVVLGAFIAAIFHLNHRALTVDHISLMASHPDGSAVVMMGNDLYKIDSVTAAEEVIALGGLGIEATVGGFAFFGNGDLLVVADVYSPSWLESLAVWTRFENRDYSRTERNQLLRCDLAASTCARFSAELADFTRTFRLFINQQSDEVYIADTSRHRLIKLDSQGKQLAERTGFRFPNQLRFVENALWMTDTNHHRVKRIETAQDNFGDELESHRIDLGFGHLWPSDLVKVGEHWWVLVPDQGMNNGKLAVYDGSWNKVRTINLPLGADPMAMLNSGDGVLVSDYGRFELYHLDAVGERLGGGQFTKLDSSLAAANADHQFYKAAVWAIQGLLFLLIAVGLVYAFIKQARSPRLKAPPVAATAEVPAEGIWVEPSKMLKACIIGLEVLTILLVVIGVVFFLTRENNEKLLLPLGLGGVLLALMVGIRPFKKMLRSKLGLFPDKVVFITGDGQQFQSLYQDIQWSDGGVKIESCIVPLSHGGRRGLFHSEHIDKLLRPRLLAENRISHWDMLKYQWRSPDRIFKSTIVMVIVLTVVLVLLQIGRFFLA